MRRILPILLLLSVAVTAEPKIWISQVDPYHKTIDISYAVGRAHCEGIQFDVTGVEGIGMVKGVSGFFPNGADWPEDSDWRVYFGKNDRTVLVFSWKMTPLYPPKGILCVLSYQDAFGFEVCLEDIVMSINGRAYKPDGQCKWLNGEGTVKIVPDIKRKGN